ncbi:solute carrier family 22 member 18 isoform X2 [Leucoraja erinacea]|uniref:solute carrier family 22 member 18 isoform X2 n=1 Tax=Leucoraja erinaceus TaxID=7782 RepID=UPI002454AABD|nr:solute carrier family 22 member 18 isoform X2 [Leucoraja erinacea]
MTGPQKDARMGFIIQIAHINMVLYSTCFWIQNGVMPYLSKRLGMDTVMFGYLQTTFAIIQLLGGPLFGRFGDLFGGRAALSLAYLSSGLTYVLMGLSTSVSLLFLSRLPSVFMHGMQAAQMIVTDLSSESERAGALGKLGISYGLGMIVGSSAGGLLISKFGESFAAYIAAVGSLVNTIIVMKYIPEHTKSLTQENKPELTSSRSIFNVNKFFRLLSIPGAAEILAIKTITALPIGVFQSMFSVVAMNYFKLEAEYNGYLMAYVGVLQMKWRQNMAAQSVSKDPPVLLRSGCGKHLVREYYHLVWELLCPGQEGSAESSAFSRTHYGNFTRPPAGTIHQEVQLRGQ